MTRPSLLLIRLTAVAAALMMLNACAAAEPAQRARPRRPVTDNDVAVPTTDRSGVPIRPASLDPERTMSVHLLDVGQGASTLLEFPCGAVLIDTGGELNEAFDSRAALKIQLDAFFARRIDLRRRLDLLIITHPHIDHMRGISALLDDVTIKNVVDNGFAGDELVKEQMATLNGYIGSHDVNHRSVRLDNIVKRNGLTDDIIDPIACRDVDPKIRVLWGGLDTDPGWGTDNYGKPRFDNQNNHSVVVRVDFGAASMLITGDLEDIAINSLIERYKDTRWLDVDIYQAGHHGSANGTTRELMAATTPSLALIAMGDSSRHYPWTAWAYGHPRATTVDMLHNGVQLARPPTEVLVGKGVKRFSSRIVHQAVFGTGWDGTVVVDVTVDGELSVRRQLRAQAPLPAQARSGSRNSDR